MGSLVHSTGDCGRATAVSDISFHLDLVVEICTPKKMFFHALGNVFLNYNVAKYIFLLRAAVEGAGARTYSYE